VTEDNEVRLEDDPRLPHATSFGDGLARYWLKYRALQASGRSSEAVKKLLIEKKEGITLEFKKDLSCYLLKTWQLDRARDVRITLGTIMSLCLLYLTMDNEVRNPLPANRDALPNSNGAPSQFPVLGGLGGILGPMHENSIS
jgi:hypothetical protein